MFSEDRRLETRAWKSVTSTPCALTIAGSDSGGGAGIQADLKTFTALGVYGATIISSLTAQNTCRVSAIHTPPVAFFETQLESVLSDIKINVVKTGMLPTTEIIRATARAIRKYEIKNVVVDPVMVATSGDSLVSDKGGGSAMEAMKKELLPLATLVTPNIAEAEALTGVRIVDEDGVREACRKLLAEVGCEAVLVKGGHLGGSGAKAVEDVRNKETVCDILYDGIEFNAFVSERIDSVHTHGTGCTLSSAIAAALAHGDGLDQAVRLAKEFVVRGIRGGQQLGIGRGRGPLFHMHAIRPFPMDESK